MRVERDNGQAVFSGEIQNRLVEIVVDVPPLEIFGPSQKSALVDGARDIIVERFLERPLKHFHAHGELRSLLIEAPENFELDLMMRKFVVLFPHVNDLLLCQLLNHRRQRL